MAIPTSVRRVLGNALVSLVAVTSTATTAHAAQYTVQLFQPAFGTFAFEQDTAPVELPHTTGTGFGTGTYTGSGFAREGSVGGDGAAAAVGTEPGISNGVNGGTLASMNFNDLVITGTGQSAPLSMNFRVDGVFEISGGGASAGLRVIAGVMGQQFQGRAFMGDIFVEPEGLLAGIPWPALSIHADITTPTVTVGLTCQPSGDCATQPGQLLLAMELGLTAGTITPLEEVFAAGNFLNTVSLPLSGPVFNLPPGFTANSPSALIVDNRFVGGPQVVPAPATLGLLAVGLVGLAATTRRTGRRQAR